MSGETIAPIACPVPGCAVEFGDPEELLDHVQGVEHRPHWHVGEKPFGYTLREAKIVQADHEKYWGEPGSAPIVKCWTDHSGLRGR